MENIASATEPTTTIGQRPDGSPWVVTVNFGDKVGIDAYGNILENRKAITPELARARAAALIAAAEWVETGKSAAIEALQKVEG